MKNIFKSIIDLMVDLEYKIDTLVGKDLSTDVIQIYRDMLSKKNKGILFHLTLRGK